MMSLVLLLILSFDFNEAMSRKGYLKGDMKNNKNKYINIQKYILNILEKLTDAQKQLFYKDSGILILYCPKMRKVKIWSLNGPWVNNQNLLARIL